MTLPQARPDQCDFPIESETRCPDRATYNAAKGTHVYAKYCGGHAQMFRVLWKKYPLDITLTLRKRPKV